MEPREPQRQAFTMCFLTVFSRPCLETDSHSTILTEIMADEFKFLRPEIKNYKAEADADLIGNGSNAVSGSTVSNTELSEFFGAH